MRFRRVLLLPILIVIIVIVFLRLVLVVLRCFADHLLIIIIAGMLVCTISIVKFGFCSVWSCFIWGLKITNCIYYRSIWFSLLNHMQWNKTAHYVWLLMCLPDLLDMNIYSSVVRKDKDEENTIVDLLISNKNHQMI